MSNRYVTKDDWTLSISRIHPDYFIGNITGGDVLGHQYVRLDLKTAIKLLKFGGTYKEAMEILHGKICRKEAGSIPPSLEDAYNANQT